MTAPVTFLPVAAHLDERTEEQWRYIGFLEQMYAALRDEDDSTRPITDWREDWPAGMPWWERRQQATSECATALADAHEELRALQAQGTAAATVRPGNGETR